MSSNKNGPPLEIKYCKKCNISNQQPVGTNEYFHFNSTVLDTILFDEKGVCAACNFNKFKWDQTIDWDEREKFITRIKNL